MANDYPRADDLAGAYWRTSSVLEVDLGPLLNAEPDDVELRILADNLPTLCWIADGDGYIGWYNRRWHAYCGTTPEDMVGWGWQSVHDQKILPEVMQRWSDCVAAGDPFEMTFPLRGADGIFRPFLTRVSPIKTQAGNVLRWVGTNTEVTALQHTQRDLANSEGFLRTLLNASAQAFYAVDTEGVTTLCNNTFLKVMGFAREQDAVGRKLHDLIHHTHPDGSHYDVKDCPIYCCAAHGLAAHVSDEYFYKLDGTPVPVEYWATPIIVGDERRGAICTFVDITERKITEHKRRAAEDGLRALNADLERQIVERSSERGTTWQLSPHLLSVISLTDGRFTRVNPGWGAALGWSEEELTGALWSDFVHPDDIEPSREGFRKLQDGEAVIDFENRYRTKDGNFRWLSWVAVPENDRLYSTARDVTREKEQAALVETRTRERDQLWNASEDLLAIADYEGKIIRTSPSWTRVFGYTEADLQSGTYNEIIHPDDLPAVLSALAEMRITGNAAKFEDRVRTRDGKWRWIAWRLSPDPNGKQLTAVGRDITDHREIEERLRQSQKMEAVGQLTGGIAHDFNNLLTGIGGSLQMIESRMTQGRMDVVDRYIVAAQGAVKRAAALTHRLLAFSRRQTLDPKPTNVNRLIAEMEELIRRTVGPSVQMEVVGAGGLWSTLVDPNQLENALLNLCINAHDAMPGGGRLTIETANKWLDDRAAKERELTPGQYVSLCVTDTGTGMTSDVVAHAFDPFFTTKPFGEGTGLGLSMIYGFARQSGGQIRIYSEIGKGTTMCLYLPRHDREAEADDDIKIQRQVGGRGDGEVVMVIDDEPTIRMLIAEVLEEQGYAAIEASDGPSGMRVLQSSARIDLLITDVGLPNGMNGRQIADAARELRPNLKVLFITGFAENAVVGNGHLEKGMHIVAKPFEMDVLARKIRELIEG